MATGRQETQAALDTYGHDIDAPRGLAIIEEDLGQVSIQGRHKDQGEKEGC